VLGRISEDFDENSEELSMVHRMASWLREEEVEAAKEKETSRQLSSSGDNRFVGHRNHSRYPHCVDEKGGAGVDENRTLGMTGKRRGSKRSGEGRALPLAPSLLQRKVQLHQKKSFGNLPKEEQQCERHQRSASGKGVDGCGGHRDSRNGDALILLGERLQNDDDDEECQQKEEEGGERHESPNEEDGDDGVDDANDGADGNDDTTDVNDDDDDEILNALFFEVMKKHDKLVRMGIVVSPASIAEDDALARS